MKRRSAINILILLIAAAYIPACNDHENGADAFGNFEAEDIIISAQMPGEIIEFNIEEGNKMKKGQYLGTIDTTQAHLKKEQLLAQKSVVKTKHEQVQAQIEVLQEQIRVLEKEKNRVKDLLSDNAATQKQMDDISGQLDVMQAQMNATKSQLNSVDAEFRVIHTQLSQINDQLSKHKIFSPETGIVLEKYAEAHEITAPGKPLFKLANLDQMTLKVYISGSQLDDLKLGQEVEVYIDKNRDDYSTLKGTVTWISDEAEFTPKIIQTKENRVNLVYAVKIVVPNDGTLKIGMPGEIKIAE